LVKEGKLQSKIYKGMNAYANHKLTNDEDSTMSSTSVRIGTILAIVPLETAVSISMIAVTLKLAGNCRKISSNLNDKDGAA